MVPAGVVKCHFGHIALCESLWSQFEKEGICQVLLNFHVDFVLIRCLTLCVVKDCRWNVPLDVLLSNEDLDALELRSGFVLYLKHNSVASVVVDWEDGAHLWHELFDKGTHLLVKAARPLLVLLLFYCPCLAARLLQDLHALANSADDGTPNSGIKRGYRLLLSESCGVAVDSLALVGMEDLVNDSCEGIHVHGSNCQSHRVVSVLRGAASHLEHLDDSLYPGVIYDVGINQDASNDDCNHLYLVNCNLGHTHQVLIECSNNLVVDSD